MSEPLTRLPEPERVLCVAAHPDDIEYGLAAAVSRWTSAGATVTYVLATRGEAGIDGMHPLECGAVRAQEERDGAAEVGVETVEFLDHTDGQLEMTLDLRRDLARVIRERRPDTVVALTHRERTSWGRVNQRDHRVVGEALVDAVRDAGNRWVFTELMGEGLDPWGGVTLVGFAGAAEPTHAVDVTGHLEPAVASLEAHQQYLDGLGEGHPGAREIVGGILGGGAETVRGRGLREADGSAADVTGVEHALLLEVVEL